MTTETRTATCSDGYVFIDNSNGEMVDLYPVRSRTPTRGELSVVV